MKILFLSMLGCASLVLGLVGLILPIVPGFLFILIALACFASLSPQMKRTLQRHPRLARFFDRLESGTHLHWLPRMKLAFWAGLEAVNPKPRHRW
ncbi:MAG: DUF454 family protein [bacterium]